MKEKRGSPVRFLPLILLAAAAVLVFLLRRRLTHMLVPLLIGGLLFYMLDPLICYLEKEQRVKRSAAIVVVFCLLLAVAAAGAAVCFPVVKQDLSAIVREAPAIGDRIRETMQTVLDAVLGPPGGENGVTGSIRGAVRAYAAALPEKAAGFLERQAARLAERMPSVSVSVADAALDGITGILFAYYFLKDKEKIGGWMLGIFPYDRRDEILRILKEIGEIAASFVRGQLLIAVIVGVLEAAGTGMLGLPAPWLLGLLGGLSNLIPYIGPFIGAVPAVFAALLVSPGRAVLTVLLFVLVQQLDNNFISPKIIEGRLGIHPVASILAVFAGGEFFGLAGILFSVPVYAILRCLLRAAIEFFAERRRPG